MFDQRIEVELEVETEIEIEIEVKVKVNAEEKRVSDAKFKELSETAAGALAAYKTTVDIFAAQHGEFDIVCPPEEMNVDKIEEIIGDHQHVGHE